MLIESISIILPVATHGHVPSTPKKYKVETKTWSTFFTRRTRVASALTPARSPCASALPYPAHHVRSPLLQPAAAAAAPAPFSDPRCLPPIPRPPSSRRHRVAVACPHPKRPLILKPPPSRPPVYHVCIAPGLPQPHIAPPTTPS